MNQNKGMSKKTGGVVSDIKHIEQSISDILTTPIGTRLIVRDYGSFIPDLIDQPLNQRILQLIRAATVLAIYRWEPRIEIKKVDFYSEKSKAILTISFTRKDIPHQNQQFTIPIRIR